MLQVYTKMILTGGQAQPGQVLFATQGDNQQQAIKFISNNNSGPNIGTPTKTITLAQAQQMGLIGGGKVQHYLPTTPQKQVSYLTNRFIHLNLIEFDIHKL